MVTTQTFSQKLTLENKQVRIGQSERVVKLGPIFVERRGRVEWTNSSGWKRREETFIYIYI